MEQGHIEQSRSGKSLVVVIRTKACGCAATSASGPKYLYSIDTRGGSSTWRLKWVAFACDTCNTPWEIAKSVDAVARPDGVSNV